MHKNDPRLDKVPDETLESLGVFVCRTCGQTLQSVSALRKHSDKCNNSTPITRTTPNTHLARDFFFAPHHSHNSTTTNHWDEALAWLRTIKDLPPPPFRQSLLLNAEYQARDDYMSLFASVIEALGTATLLPDDTSDSPSPEFDPTPFWMLTVLFEQLILAPKPPDSNEKIRPLIRRRIGMFTQGRIKELYLEAHSVDNTRPPSAPPRPHTAAQRNRHAQLAADVDSFGVCAKRLTTDTPVAKIHTDETHPKYNFPALKKLYPKCTYRWTHRHRQQRVASKRQRGRSRRSSRDTSIFFTPDTIIRHIESLHRGKAPGLQADSLDIFIELAARIKEERLPASLPQHLSAIFTHIANGDVPPILVHVIRTTYLVALQKDPEDCTKLRPLGIPAALRRITAHAVAKQLEESLAKHVLPHNYAFSVKGGITFAQQDHGLAI